MLNTFQSAELDLNKTDNTGKCNAREKCCKRESKVKSLVHGCTVGYRIIDDGTTVQCIPNDCE